MPLPGYPNGHQAQMGPPPRESGSGGHEATLGTVCPSLFNMGHQDDQPTARVQGNDHTPDALRLLRMAHSRGQPRTRQRYDIGDPTKTETSRTNQNRSLPDDSCSSCRCRCSPVPGATAARTDSTRVYDAYYSGP